MSAAALILEQPVSRAKGFALSVAVHAVIFAAGGLGLASRTEFGMSDGGGAEVDLVAAPAPLLNSAAVPSQAIALPPSAPEEDPIPAPAAASAVVAPAAAMPNAILRAAGGTGDGSSAVPGKDATTQKGGDGEALKLPGYFLNPPPPYPAQARAERQEGVVLLEVLVNARGRVDSLRLEKTSGFPLLDAAALAGVKNWRFKAARLAGIAVETTVQIPIRFQLK